ncbi:MAG TPA: site-specific integrase [Opitutaceae bacterium]|nr:site-specific integrase [Opitutaceae bacterium]
MNQKNSFVVSQFTNPSGEVVFRVSGWLDGRRVRKNFSTRAEAEAERQILEVQLLQGHTGIRTAITRLTDDQLHDAEAAFRRLKGNPTSLLTYLDFALANYCEAIQPKLLGEAVTDYVAEKTKQHEQTLLSNPQLRGIANELKVLKNSFPAKMIAEFTPALLLTHLERGKPSLKTYNNRRSILSTFFKFALQKEWITGNPVEKTPHHRIKHRRGTATTIAAQKAAELMAYVEQFEHGIMVPYFAICLFAGIRPCTRTGEISKLQAESVHLETGVIHIEPEVSKVRMKRLVTIQPNLSAWLRAYPLKQFSILPTNAEELRAKIFRKFQLTHDVLRHTFISMFVGKFRSMGEAALQAGNSETIIRRHYLDLKSQAEAEEFFGILPKQVAPITAQFKVVPTAGIANRRQVRPAA